VLAATDRMWSTPLSRIRRHDAGGRRKSRPGLSRPLLSGAGTLLRSARIDRLSRTYRAQLRRRARSSQTGPRRSKSWSGRHRRTLPNRRSTAGHRSASCRARGLTRSRTEGRSVSSHRSRWPHRHAWLRRTLAWRRRGYGRSERRSWARWDQRSRPRCIRHWRRCSSLLRGWRLSRSNWRCHRWCRRRGCHGRRVSCRTNRRTKRAPSAWRRWCCRRRSRFHRAYGGRLTNCRRYGCGCCSRSRRSDICRRSRRFPGLADRRRSRWRRNHHHGGRAGSAGR
jgi:hypothetical protein